MRLSRYILALLPALTMLPAIAGPAAAQIPQPPNRFFGNATLNGQRPAAGTQVTAVIGDRQCGLGQVDEAGRYRVDVTDASTVPGCGAPETTITFRIADVPAAESAPYRRGNFTELNLTAPAAPAPARRFRESALSTAEDRPCIPEVSQRQCDATRLALWNGRPEAWAQRGVTDPDAVFNETVVLRIRAGDPLAIRNILPFIGSQPYLKITRLRYTSATPGASEEFIEISNYGTGVQDMTGWTVRSPGRNLTLPFPANFVLVPEQTCRVYSGVAGANSCGGMTFNTPDVWPDEGGTVVLFFDALALPGDETQYNADPNNQPPPPNLQGVEPA